MNTYRLILTTAPGRIDTGATYAGCSSNNAASCDPKQFARVEDAVAYAEMRGEIPVMVTSAEQAFAIAEGREPINEDMIVDSGGGMFSNLFSNPLLVGGLAIVAVLFLRKRG